MIPNMSTTGCTKVIFIMREINDIEEEMDMWTREFQRYFPVYKVNSYEEAFQK